MPSKSTLLTLLGQTFGSGAAVGAAAATGALDDNVIRLGDQNYPIRGISVAEQVSEFEAGLKIGPATYDNREHAFFIVMDDFSAGLGMRFLNVREELGGFWDPQQSNAADTSRARYLVLPPKQTDVVNASGPTYNLYAGTLGVGSASHRWVYNKEYSTIFIAAGSAIYKSTDGGRTFTKDHDVGTDGIVLSFSTSYENVFGEATLQANGTMSNMLIRGEVWGTGVIYPPYVWTENTRQASVHDSIWWDGKIVIIDSIGMAFGIWERDPDTLTIDIAWNVADPLDGEFIFKKLHHNYEGVILGVAMAPWGQPSIYFHDSRKLYVVDFFARKYYPVDIGIGRNITGSTMYNGAMVLLDGNNAWEYNPSGQTVRNIGLPDKQGRPPSLIAGSSGEWVLRHPMPVDKDLYAVATTLADTTGSPRSMLMKYNGQGWHQVGRPMEYLVHGAACVTSSPYTANVTRSIICWGTDLAQTGATMTHTYFELPTYSDTPIPQRESFGNSGAAFTSGWMDGGFLDIDGTLLRMRIDAMHLTSTETVKVEYQLDNDESSTWVQMVDEDNLPATFTSSRNTLYFSSDTSDGLASYNPRQGIRFNTVRFRITLTRGSNEKLTPIVKALILMYIKVPDFRLSVTFSVDVNRMLEEVTDTQFYVNGAHPDLRDVHQKLISQWNEHLLHQLVVPNVVTEDDNAFVRIVGMPLRFEDFKDSITGRGVIELTVLEPLERVE